jgi:Domain of unknown function (DUF4129)
MTGATRRAAKADHARPAASDDDIVRGCIAILAFCLAAGLLSSADALPLHWLTGQRLVLLGTLLGLAVEVTWSTLRLASLDGLAASDFSRSVIVIRLAVLALVLLVLPAAQWHVAGAGNSLSSSRFVGPVAVSAGLCWLVVAASGTAARTWSLLHVHISEVGDTGGRVAPAGIKRDVALARLRGLWVAGAVLMALAMIAHDSQTSGQSWPGVLALLGYTASGLIFVSHAAHTRMRAAWRLGGFDISDTLAADWRALSLRAALLTLLAAALVVASRVLELAHAAVGAAAGAALWLIRLLPVGGFTSSPSPCSHSCAQPRSAATHQPRLPPRPPAHEVGGFWRALGDLVALLQHALVAYWSLLLALLALAAIARFLIGTRGSGAGGWRALAALLLRDLRALWTLLSRSSLRFLVTVVAAPLTVNVKRARRFLSRREPSFDRLAPRAAVIAIYTAMLDYLARRGVPRRPAQTPAEYARELAGRLPAGQDAMQHLTEVFVAARYGDPRVERPDAHRARSLWQAIRSSLRRYRA